MTPETRTEIEYALSHPDMLYPAAQLREWLAEALREIDQRQLPLTAQLERFFVAERAYERMRRIVAGK